MRSPGQGRQGEGRIGVADKTSASSNEIFCVTCIWMIRGLHFGRPELFCLCDAVREAHASFFGLVGPKRMVRRSEAWLICRGQHFERAGDHS